MRASSPTRLTDRMGASRPALLIALVALAAACASDPGGATLELRLRLPPQPVGTRVLAQVARGEAFEFDTPWLVDRDRQEAAAITRYDDADGADLSLSVVSDEGPGELRLRLVYCPEGRTDESCSNAAPGELPHHWLLFPDAFFAGYRSRWHAAQPDADVMDEWAAAPFWAAEPSAPWATLPAVRAPCAAGSCGPPEAISRCAVWVPDCRSLVGGSFPLGTSFCTGATHDADRCE